MTRRVVLGALVVLALASAPAAAAERGLAVVYVSPNVGMASGGHAALRADDTVYHLQNTDADLLLLVREGWSAFRLVYAQLENRPLEVARIHAAPETTERVQRSFSRVYVAQQMELARRDALRADVSWLEAFAARAPAPPLRGAGLVSPERAGDSVARALRSELEERIGSGELARITAGSEAQVAASAAAGADLQNLREAVALREAVRALTGSWGLAPTAPAAVPPELDRPLSANERASLEKVDATLVTTISQLLRSARPDRGYPLLLAQARALAVRRSLATDRLVLLDAFKGNEVQTTQPDDVSDYVREQRRIYAGKVYLRGRDTVLNGDDVDEDHLNLLEEAAATVARGGRADAAGPLSEYGLRKLPALGRSVDVPEPGGDVPAALADARARLAEQDARLEARWGYDVSRRNCITELSRTTAGAFASDAEAVRALGGLVPPPDEFLGWVPFVFFTRASERLRVDEVDSVASHRTEELARVLTVEPGVWPAARESAVPTSTIYTPRLRDGAFLLFTDDVFLRRPLYGAANLAYGLGYSVYGAAAAPFDGGARLHAGASGVLWSLPELFFVNVRKGSFDWED